MKTAQHSPKVEFSLLNTALWVSTVFPARKNARDCTDKSRACGAGGAWLNYYIKSIRRLGRGPEISAVLGEKSGMTGSCERDACDGVWLRPGTVRSFATHRPDRGQSEPSRQGISSTDKDVIIGGSKVRMTGGFSSSLQIKGSDATGRIRIARLPVRGVALVDGRCRRGLDSGAVSVKLPLGVREARAARRAYWHAHFRTGSGTQDWSPPSGRRGDDGRTTVLRIKEVLPSARRRPVRTGSMDPVATRRRTQKGNKAGISCFMRTSGATSA